MSYKIEIEMESLGIYHEDDTWELESFSNNLLISSDIKIDSTIDYICGELLDSLFANSLSIIIPAKLSNPQIKEAIKDEVDRFFMAGIEKTLLDLDIDISDLEEVKYYLHFSWEKRKS